MEPLHNLNSTYNIDTNIDFFPHHFNRPEHRNYVGEMPDEDTYGVKNMDADTYDKKSNLGTMKSNQNQTGISNMK